MPLRYELTEEQWVCIRNLLPGRKESVGRTAADHRVFVSGVWDHVFRTLVKGVNNEHLMIDSTIVRAPQQAATGRKKGPDQALGRSRGGLTTKIHLLCHALGQPIDFLLTPGQVAGGTQAVDLLGERKPGVVLADKGYDTKAIVQPIEATGAVAAIPPKTNRTVQRPDDQTPYRQRNRIERCFSNSSTSAAWRAASKRINIIFTRSSRWLVRCSYCANCRYNLAFAG
jgi:transposase